MITIELEVQEQDQLSLAGALDHARRHLNLTYAVIEASEDFGWWVSFTGTRDEVGAMVYEVYGPGFDEWALEQVEAGVVRPLVDESR